MASKTPEHTGQDWKKEFHSSTSPPPSSSLKSTSVPAHSPSCPFCAIALAYPPIRPSLPEQPTRRAQAEEEKTDSSPIPQARTYLILSTKHVLAFLDIMPLTKGHILLVTRGHWQKLGDVSVKVGQELGKWLPIISRVVTKTVLGKDADDDDDADWAHWNVVQNNGIRAAQVVPHVHFHIVPRPPLSPSPPTTTTTTAGVSSSTSTNAAATAAATATPPKRKPFPSYVMFGRGQREELDDEEGEELAQLMREELAREVKRVREKEGVDLDYDFDYHYHQDGKL